MPKLLKIAITGPESTGKSTLARDLARHYRTIFVPEFARFYLEAFSANYSATEVLEMARGQMVTGQALLEQAEKILLFDTDLSVFKIWYEHAYGECPEWLNQAFTQQTYDLYLLMNIDLEWQPDPLREHPHLRDYFFQKYYNLLTEQGFPVQVISGQAEKRLATAIKYIDELLLQ
jgi:NadR type nicotinamide-nucleotide adenylyltransferase